MRTVRTEFPSYDGELPTIEGFVDSSWKNDACPSMEKHYPEHGAGLYVKLWCDYRDEDKREYPGTARTKRFTLVVYSPTDEDGTEIASCEAINGIVAALKQHERTFTIPPLDLARAFCRTLSQALDPGDLAVVNARNDDEAAYGDKDACASHDFLDANQYMLDAIESFVGVADYHFAQNTMINAAWAIAKKAHFNHLQCEAPGELDPLITFPEVKDCKPGLWAVLTNGWIVGPFVETEFHNRYVKFADGVWQVDVRGDSNVCPAGITSSRLVMQVGTREQLMSSIVINP